MPFVRIDLPDHVCDALARSIGDVVHDCLQATIDVPPNDRFQVIARHPPGGIVHAGSYLGITYSEGLMMIQVTLSAGRSIEKKKALYRLLADELHRLHGVRREDVFIQLVEVTREDWSFGNGIMQYAPPT